MSRNIQLAIQNESLASPIPRKSLLKKWVRAALSKQFTQAEVTLRFVDAEEGQSLNRDYRQKDYATNVLTFTFNEDLPPGAPLMGDLVLCGSVIEREAFEQKKPLLAHYCHMIVHGMLHLQGFDHIDEAEAEAMEALETQIVTKLGYDDPYLSEKE
ncbi:MULTISPECIES: rRNA maturation RNase YbeY [Deefgea]|uniref:Endoribonuclease YbeY n=1 Tax=Deefgea chitinilytica TaxID=570276 RepID=A0ABS2CET1_9NEIS|nr:MULTISPECIES: rRNA maturation RNase YbeY [Deefgea]MBM5572512.1 rRNA maturation RNase YbeY [Deefgea chitinilytica]MBM9889748.1 rRNA maturation RNase YbeY [Deefgea sp. CFH1-16]